MFFSWMDIRFRVRWVDIVDSSPLKALPEGFFTWVKDKIPTDASVFEREGSFVPFESIQRIYTESHQVVFAFVLGFFVIWPLLKFLCFLLYGNHIFLKSAKYFRLSVFAEFVFSLLFVGVGIFTLRLLEAYKDFVTIQLSEGVFCFIASVWLTTMLAATVCRADSKKQIAAPEEAPRDLDNR